MIQTSAVHTGRCDVLVDVLEQLLDRMVRPVGAARHDKKTR